MFSDPLVAVSGYLIIAVLWIIPPLAIAGYVVTRRGLCRSRGLAWFDSVVIALCAVALVVILSPVILGSDRVSYEDRLVGYYTFPLVISFVFVPLLLIAAVIRYCIFSKPPEQTRAP
jgi:cytochrome bd-type quinol oxidase subunit 2